MFWWDTKGPGVVKPSERHDGKRLRSATVAGNRDGLPDRRIVHRWRKKLNEPDKHEGFGSSGTGVG